MCDTVSPVLGSIYQEENGVIKFCKQENEMHFGRTTPFTIWRMNCVGGNDGDTEAKAGTVLVTQERSVGD